VVQADSAGDAAASDGLAARFAALQRHFVEGLPARWSALALAPRGSDAQRAELHRLAGAAGSFGYTALGQAASAAEHCNDVELGAALSTLKALLWLAIKAETAQ